MKELADTWLGSDSGTHSELPLKCVHPASGSNPPAFVKLWAVARMPLSHADSRCGRTRHSDTAQTHVSYISRQGQFHGGNFSRRGQARVNFSSTVLERFPKQLRWHLFEEIRLYFSLTIFLKNFGNHT